ncbi:hypothetical protein [Pontibaca salina]|uniref:Uncharacterized protein n=1 Tax=Pontibaca salina TaxID=2795731 RepID=A0A934HUE1_9RHOB|nr:hypothetical protein [Pontibaca salina]MBI6630705.1 hypothetical protein [Pontibaca salina]
MAVQAHSTDAPGVARLNEIHDCLTLSLDATERSNGYSQAEREARSYIRTALRRVNKMLEVGHE